MTDVETPRNERTETVSRVLAALTSGTTDGAIERDTLRDALESEGQSLLDLPEVGLWLALTQISLTHPDSTSVDVGHTPDGVVIDLRGDPVEEVPVEEEPEAVEAPAVAPFPVLGRAPEPIEPIAFIEVEEAAQRSEEPAPSAPISAAEPSKRKARLRRRVRRLPDIVLGPPVPSLSLPSDRTPLSPVSLRPMRGWPPGLADRLDELDVHLHVSLARPATLRLGDPSSCGTSTVDRSAFDPLAALAFVAPLLAHVESSLAVPLDRSTAPAETVGTARPDPYWAPSVVRSISGLDAWLRAVLAEPLRLPLPDPSLSHDATLDPAWPPALVRRLGALDGFLRSLFSLPTIARVPASRLAGASNGAVPEPYWPRHLVRSGAVPTPLPAAPRTPDVLEADLQRLLDGVALIGEAAIDDSAAEIEIALAALVRSMPLDRLGRVHPATLATFLVRRTVLHPNPTDFDETIPVTALRRTNPVGLAFSEALVRLSKPVFREVEHRDEFDHRVRYLRRMQLHGGVSPEVLPAVLGAVLDSHWAGAGSGREVAQDWLMAARSVTAMVGDPAFRLLTRTDHGARMLEALLDLVRWRWLDPQPTAPPPGLEPLPADLVERAWAWLSVQTRPESAWGEGCRPRLRVGTGPADGPELVLPRSSGRWHLNGELLGYGSPTHQKTVALPISRNGKWGVTVGTSRRTSPLDVGLQSAADDRIVLAFDERDRYHHHVLPLGGTTASIVAPAGSRVDGERERTLLVGRWVGFERIAVELRGLAEVTVSQRGRVSVTYEVDHRLGVAILGASDAPGAAPHEAAVDRPLRLVFRGHVPTAAEVEVVVADGPNRATSVLSDLWIDHDGGTFGLDRLLASGARRPATVTVTRRGFEPSVNDITIAARRDPAPPPLSRPDPATSPTLLALSALVTGGSHDDPDLDLDELWLETPILAAATDDWRSSPAAMRRWIDATGWTPPGPAIAPATALRSLLEPLVATVRTPADAVPTHVGAGGHLTAGAWSSGLADDADRLGGWLDRHQRPLWRWRATRPALRQFDPVWAALGRLDRGRVVLPLVSAALLSFVDGPQAVTAAGWLDEALQLAPTLAVSTSALAVAYARLQRIHPESRFQAIPVDLR